MQQRVMDELNLKFQETLKLNEELSSKIKTVERVNKENLSEKELLNEEVRISREILQREERQRMSLEDEIAKLKKRLSDKCAEFEDKNSHKEESLVRSPPVSLANVVSMLRSEDLNEQIYAAKAIANLAADDSNQEKIVEEGGLDALLMLLESTEDSTALRVTAVAVANLAMNGLNQGLIVSKGGGRLLANIAHFKQTILKPFGWLLEQLQIYVQMRDCI